MAAFAYGAKRASPLPRAKLGGRIFGGAKLDPAEITDPGENAANQSSCPLPCSPWKAAFRGASDLPQGLESNWGGRRLTLDELQTLGRSGPAQSRGSGAFSALLSFPRNTLFSSPGRSLPSPIESARVHLPSRVRPARSGQSPRAPAVALQSAALPGSFGSGDSCLRPALLRATSFSLPCAPRAPVSRGTSPLRSARRSSDREAEVQLLRLQSERGRSYRGAFPEQAGLPPIPSRWSAKAAPRWLCPGGPPAQAMACRWGEIRRRSVGSFHPLRL